MLYCSLNATSPFLRHGSMQCTETQAGYISSCNIFPGQNCKICGPLYLTEKRIRYLTNSGQSFKISGPFLLRHFMVVLKEDQYSIDTSMPETAILLLRVLSETSKTLVKLCLCVVPNTGLRMVSMGGFLTFLLGIFPLHSAVITPLSPMGICIGGIFLLGKLIMSI